MASEEQGTWSSLLDPVAVAADNHHVCPDRRTTAATYTSIGREVEFWFEKSSISKGMWLLHANNLETLDPYGGEPIRSFVEVICSHGGLILLRLHTPHRNFPTEYFVYGYHTCGRHGPWVDKLPEIEPLIYSTSSMGLLSTGDGYVVANLRQKLDPKTRELEMFLDSYDSRNKQWRQQRPVELVLSGGKDQKYLWGWQTDQVIPFDRTLLWVDLSRGIMLCRGGLDNTGNDNIKLDLVPHPRGLLPDDDDLRWEHPQPFCSVGCCDGKVKLVSLPSNKHGGDDAGEVLTWTLDWDALKWNDEPSTILSYERLRADMASRLRTRKQKPSKILISMPCYPVLSTDQSNILYLTAAERSRAWLLRIDMHSLDANKHTCTLQDIAYYPRFCDHMNPPCPSDLPKYLNTSRSVGDQRSSHQIPTDAMDQHFRQSRRIKRNFGRLQENGLRYSKRLRALSTQIQHG